MTSSQPRRRELRVPLAALSLVLPVLFGIFLVVRERGARAVRPVTAPSRPAASDAAAVEGWGAELESRAGLRLFARLVSLHVDAERQAFDARALRARLKLDEGAPWRLTLTRSAAPGSSAGASELDLTDWRVEDAHGVALAPIVRAPLPQSNVAFDPLRALLGPPTTGLGPGGEVTLVLWGRRPADDARLVSQHEPAFQGVLEPRLFDDPGELSLARVDRRLIQGPDDRPR